MIDFISADRCQVALVSRQAANQHGHTTRPAFLDHPADVVMQVVGRRFMDENVISILRHVEEVRPWVAVLNAAVSRIEDTDHAEVGAGQQGT